MTRKHIYAFDNTTSTGIDAVPLNSIILVESTGQQVQLIDKTGVNDTTTIATLLASPSLFNEAYEQSDTTIVKDASYVHTDNNFTSTLLTKLNGVESGATADQSASEILTALLTVDGAGSGLDADTLDGNEASAFATSGHTHSYLPLAGGTVTGITSFTNVTDSTSTTTGAIKTSGGIGAAKSIYAGGNVTAYSDRRLKDNIVQISDAVSKVLQLNGYTYDRTDLDLRQTGVIAQEVLEVLPEAVTQSKEGIYGVSYGNMVGLLIEAIKELNAKIEVLEAK